MPRKHPLRGHDACLYLNVGPDLPISENRGGETGTKPVCRLRCVAMLAAEEDATTSARDCSTFCSRQQQRLPRFKLLPPRLLLLCPACLSRVTSTSYVSDRTAATVLIVVWREAGSRSRADASTSFDLPLRYLSLSSAAATAILHGRQGKSFRCSRMYAHKDLLSSALGS